MSADWENDDDFLDDDEEEDLEDEAPAPPPTPPPPPPSNVAPIRRETSSRSSDAGKKQRHLRVKPMSASMRTRWPDVTSCLLTLNSGKQVMFVRP